MSEFYFKPWIGKNYKKSPFQGKKILILGESHYKNTGSEKGSGFTNYIFKEEILTEKSNPKTHNCIVKTFLNKRANTDEMKDFWNSVAFYNYIIELLPGPRIAPKETLWEKSKPSFYKVLDELKPDIMVALGYRLWNKIPNEKGKWIFMKETRTPFQDTIYKIKYKNGYCLATEIMHPSARGFSYTKWHPRVKNILEYSMTIK